MDVVLSENQTMLQDTTRRFVQDRSPVSLLRKLTENGSAYPDEAWRECARQGWIALLTPEQHGGLGDEAEGVVDAAIVAEELGRVVFAGSFLPAAVTAFAIAQSGSDAQREALLPGIAAGELNTAWCFAGTGPQAGLEPDGVRAVRRDGGFVLDGIAGYVEGAQGADWLLVAAAGTDGLSQFLLPATMQGIAVEPLRSLDLGRPLARVRFERVAVGEDGLLGKAGGAAAAFERQLQVALVLQCAELVGLIDRALEFTLDYVQQRVAFGRVIGSFQALKHRLADHVAELESAKAATAHAAKSVQNDAPDAAIAVSVAKSQCGRWGTIILRDCVQMHGGIGLTWDHDLHFYLRRAVASEALWGTPALHHERLADLAGV